MRPSRGLRASSALLTAFVASVVFGSPLATAQADPTFTHRPVVFVHGYNAGPGVWGDMRTYTRDYGYSPDELLVFDYSHDTPGETSITTLGEDLDHYIDDNNLVDRSPDHRIDIVAHSMGGLVARAYLAAPAHRYTTAHLVTYGSPNHGTDPARFGCDIGVKCDLQVQQMAPRSEFQQQLQTVGETPGPTRYVTFRSNIGDEPIVLGATTTGLCDGIVFGVTETGESAGAYAGRTPVLDGADNFVTPCLSHGDYYHDDWTRGRTLDMIADVDGRNTPKAVQTDCGGLESFRGEDDWVNAYGQACVTATREHGGVGPRDVRTNLSIRGCGYYYSFARLWEYAGTNEKYLCETRNVQGVLWRAGQEGASTTAGAGVDARTMELYTPTTRADPGRLVAGTWIYDVHAYNDERWDVKRAESAASGFTIG